MNWKNIEKNNVTFIFNALYAKKEKRYSAYVEILQLQAKF